MVESLNKLRENKIYSEQLKTFVVPLSVAENIIQEVFNDNYESAINEIYKELEKVSKDLDNINIDD